MVDRVEVTNREYKSFVDNGGYSNDEYWKDVFLEGDKILTLAEARSRFVDRTGQPGPATWTNRTYPKEEDDSQCEESVGMRHRHTRGSSVDD